MSTVQEDRDLLEACAAACGYDTTHSMNAVRLTLEHPVAALLIRREVDSELKLVHTGWNPLDASSCSGMASAIALQARFRLSTCFDDRFKSWGEVAHCTYPTGPHTCNSATVRVSDAGGAEAALCRAIVLAVVAMHALES